jgi:MFS family permease
MRVLSGFKGFPGRFDRQVWSLFGASIIAVMGSSLVMTFMSIYMYESLGMTMVQVGIADFITTIVGAAAAYMGGALCDTYGRKMLLVAGLSLQVFSYVLISLSINEKLSIPLFILALAFNSFNGGIYNTIPSVMIADVVEPSRLVEAYGLIRIGSNLGWVAGPIIGGTFLIFTTYANLFYITALTTFTYLIIAIFILRDTSPKAVTERFKFKDIITVAQDRLFLAYCILSLFMIIPYQQMYTLLSVYSSAYVGLNQFWIGVLFAVSGLMVVSMQYYISMRVRRYRMTSMIALGALVFALGFGLLSTSTAIIMPFIGMAVITTGEMVWSPATSTLQANMSPEKMRGRYFGLNGLITSIGWAIGPLFGGVLKDSLNNDVPSMWAVVGALFLICMLGFVMLGKVLPANMNGALKLSPKAEIPEKKVNV